MRINTNQLKEDLLNALLDVKGEPLTIDQIDQVIDTQAKYERRGFATTKKEQEGHSQRRERNS